MRFIVSAEFLFLFFLFFCGFSYTEDFNIHELVGRLIDTWNGSRRVLLGTRGGDLHNLYLAIVNRRDIGSISAVTNNSRMFLDDITNKRAKIYIYIPVAIIRKIH